MAKQTGLGDGLYVAEFDLSGDVGSLGRIGGGNSPLAVTGINKSGPERLGGKRDGAIEFTSYFNDDTAQEHEALSPLPTADVVVTYLRGSALGAEAASIVAKQINYDPTRGDDGSLTFEVSAQANGFGLEWGHNLTGDGSSAIFESTGAENLPGFTDVAAATDFGMQVYFHLFAFTGTSVTLAIQDSDDDGAVDPYAAVTGATSGALTAPGTVRAATGATENVKEWLRVAATGTYSVADFAVIAVRNLTAVVF